MTEDIALALLGILGTVLSLVIGLAADAARKRWGIEIQVRHREALHSAVMTAAKAALGKTTSTSAGGIDRTAREDAIDYVRRSVPDAIAALSPAPDVLDRLVISKVQELIAGRGK